MRDQKAAEDSIYKFLGRFLEARQPEDVTSLEATLFLTIEANRGQKPQALKTLAHLKDFWDFLIQEQGYFLSNPFLQPLASRWTPPNGGPSSRAFHANKPAGSEKFEAGPTDQ